MYFCCSHKEKGRRAAFIISPTGGEGRVVICIFPSSPFSPGRPDSTSFLALFLLHLLTVPCFHQKGLICVSIHDLFLWILLIFFIPNEKKKKFIFSNILFQLHVFTKEKLPLNVFFHFHSISNCFSLYSSSPYSYFLFYSVNHGGLSFFFPLLPEFLLFCFTFSLG